MVKIAPSVLSADFSKTDTWLAQFEQATVDCIHWDVMDNAFVPNRGVNWNWILETRPKTKLPFDCHLMVKEPEVYIAKMAGMGADSITFHVEATKSEKQTIELIEKTKNLGLKCGIAIDAQTPPEKIIPFLGKADVALVMSVQAGFGGQSFLPQALEKIKKLQSIIEKEKWMCEIQVDGGITLQTGKQAVAAGADILVAGSFVFKYKTVKDAILELKQL